MRACRRKVEELHAALKADDAGPARELIRGLIDAIVLVPEDGRLRVEVRGELAAILRLSGCADEKAPAGEPGLLVEQIKMVAGAGFEPCGLLRSRRSTQGRVMCGRGPREARRGWQWCNVSALSRTLFERIQARSDPRLLCCAVCRLMLTA
jgi:hypothetical protein